MFGIHNYLKGELDGISATLGKFNGTIKPIQIVYIDSPKPNSIIQSNIFPIPSSLTSNTQIQMTIYPISAFNIISFRIIYIFHIAIIP